MLTSFSVGRESGAPLFTNLSEGSLSEVSHRGLFTYKAATQSNKLRNIKKLDTVDLTTTANFLNSRL